MKSFYQFLNFKWVKSEKIRTFVWLMHGNKFLTKAILLKKRMVWLFCMSFLHPTRRCYTFFLKCRFVNNLSFLYSSLTKVHSLIIVLAVLPFPLLFNHFLSPNVKTRAIFGESPAFQLFFILTKAEKQVTVSLPVILLQFSY